MYLLKYERIAEKKCTIATWNSFASFHACYTFRVFEILLEKLRALRDLHPGFFQMCVDDITVMLNFFETVGLDIDVFRKANAFLQSYITRRLLEFDEDSRDSSYSEFDDPVVKFLTFPSKSIELFETDNINHMLDIFSN